MPRTRPSALTISVTTSPQPPCRFTRRRNAVSVIPAIGAMAKGDSRFTVPIFIALLSAGRVFGPGAGELVCPDCARVDFHAHCLPDEVDRKDQPRAAGVLPQQP